MSTLAVVGTGINVGQLTAEAADWIRTADKLLYCVSDAATERMLLTLNQNSESLYGYYGEGKQRAETYEQMVLRTLECLEQVDTLAVAYYGHPGFFVSPSHRAIRIARERGHEAFMLPSVSSFDCLLADLGLNVASGCQIFEATDLMIRERSIDVCSHVVVMQVSSLGDFGYSFAGFDHRNLASLREYLRKYYPDDFVVTAYYASQFSVAKPRVDQLKVAELTLENVKSIATLYVPPLRTATLHLRRLKEYGIEEKLLQNKTLVPLNVKSEDELIG